MAKEITIAAPVRLADRHGNPITVARNGVGIEFADPCACTKRDKNSKWYEDYKTGKLEPSPTCDTCKGKGIVPSARDMADWAELITNDPKFTQGGMIGLTTANALVRGCLGEVGTTFRLTDAEHKFLVDVIDKPTPGTEPPGEIAKCFFPFYVAAYNAVDAK